MRVIARRVLRLCWERHASAEGPLREWYAFVGGAEWRTMQDIKNDFPAASFVGNNRVVFNIGGNNFRLVVVAPLQVGLVYIRFVGTHAEYDKVDVRKV